MKYHNYSCKLVLSATLLFFSSSIYAISIIETNWWSNQTSSQNVIDPLFGNPPITERVRLADFTSGFIEGTVGLGQTGLWNLLIPVAADSNAPRDPNDFVDVYINGAILGRAFNDPADFVANLTTTISGSQFSYRFEFTSSNSITGLHQAVLRGTASSAPIPATWMLLVLGLMPLALKRRYSSVTVDTLEKVQQLAQHRPNTAR